MITEVRVERPLENKTIHQKIIGLLETEQHRYSNSKGQHPNKITINNRDSQPAIVITSEGGNFTSDLLEKLKNAGLYISHPSDFRDTNFFMAVTPSGQNFKTGIGGISELGEDIFPKSLFPEPLPEGSRLHVTRADPGTAKNLRLATWVAENVHLPFARDPMEHGNNLEELELDIATRLSEAYPDLHLDTIRVSGDYQGYELRVRLGYQGGHFDADFVSAGATGPVNE